MRRFLEPDIILRLLIPLIFIAILGIAPRPHEITKRLWQTHRLLEAPSSSSTSIEIAKGFAEIARRIPWRSELWEKAGLYALQGGDAAAAINYLEQAAANNHLSPAGQIALGDAYQEKGDLSTAIQAWETTLRFADPSVALYTRLLDTHLALKDYPASINDLQALIALQPTNAELRYQLGLLLTTQQPEAALAHLVQAAELDPNLSEATQTLVSSIRTARYVDDPAYSKLEAGRALASIGEWELAVEAFHQSTQDHPNYAEAWAFLGEARQHLIGADLKNALSDLEKALELDPASLTANIFLALYWQRQGHYDQALVYLVNATEFHPDNPALQVELGNTYAMLGDLEAAHQAYQSAIEMNPRNPVYLRLMAAFSIKHEYHLRQIGLPAARQAVIVAPDDPDGLDTMGQVLILLDDTSSAERFLQRALQVDPDYPPAHLHLGIIYALNGETQRAHQKFNLASSLAPDTPIAEQAQRLLQTYAP
ncbi:MAG: tetratricopeptide repeat protein [Anaerolineales bacterium]|nr:tetratricopeptide repeat protein [Anaerolineales bacterium]